MHDALERSRAEIAAQPQHLLLTLWGDYWYPRRDELPSSALVDLLAEFDVSGVNARAALSRVARRGLLAARRAGRHSLYAVTDEGQRTLDEGTRRIFGFGHPSNGTDGRWTLVAFSVPEDIRGVRSTLRIRLGWLGFAALFDAVWVAPGDRRSEVATVLVELGISSAAVMVGEVSDLSPGGDLTRAWDLEALRSRYESFIAEFRPIVADHLTGRDALIARTSVIDVWRTFPGTDPELPAELLPPHWPQAEARQLFAEIYDRLGPAATGRVREVLAPHDGGLAELATHHTTVDALDLVGVER